MSLKLICILLDLLILGDLRYQAPTRLVPCWLFCSQTFHDIPIQLSRTVLEQTVLHHSFQQEERGQVRYDTCSRQGRQCLP